jgi:hypothetical protein
MAGWLSDEDLNCFNEEQFLDLLEEPERPICARSAKQTSSNIADLEELSRSTEASSLSRAAASKHLKVSHKSVTIRKQFPKASKPHPVSSDRENTVEPAWNPISDSTTLFLPSEAAIQVSTLNTKEIEDAVHEIKARVEMIKDNLTFTKDILSKLIRYER